jgi:RimJ/RimL family protein N-acetyltransferase
MTAAHYDAVAAFQRDPAYMAYMGGPRDDAAIDELMRRNLAHWDAYGFGMWVLQDGDDTPVGIAGLRHVDESPDSDVGLGYGLVQRLWGQGLATEVARACVAIARDTLRLASVIARAHADNAASIAVMEKLGFEFERDLHEDGVHGVQYRRRFGY